MRHLMLLFFLVLPGLAQAEKEKSFALDLTYTETCKSLSLGFTVASDHTEKGDRGGLLNERNHGTVGECFLDPNRRFYTITGALTNSQWGPTLFHGYGMRFRSERLWRFAAEAGYEVALTYYERGCPPGIYAEFCRNSRRGGAFLAPLPMLYLGVNMELPSVRQALAPFMSHETQVGLPSFMQTSMGELTVGRRTLGYPFFRSKEKIHLYSVTWTYRFK